MDKDYENAWAYLVERDNDSLKETVRGGHFLRSRVSQTSPDEDRLMISRIQNVQRSWSLEINATIFLNALILGETTMTSVGYERTTGQENSRKRLCIFLGQYYRAKVSELFCFLFVKMATDGIRDEVLDGYSELGDCPKR